MGILSNGLLADSRLGSDEESPVFLSDGLAGEIALTTLDSVTVTDTASFS